MDQKQPSHPAEDTSGKSSYVQPDAELDAIWRFAVGLDLGSRSVLEAEVLLWRICKAKAISPDTMNRALNEDWEK